MVPWNKLPEDYRKVILTMVIVFGGASASCQLGPPVCDPPPPPATTPMICDPPPPPATPPPPTVTPTFTPTVTSTSIPTPMICDPAPPPSLTPMICDPPPPPPPVTVAPGQHFSVKTVQITPDAGQDGVAIRGTIADAYGQPLAGLAIVVEGQGGQVWMASDEMGHFAYRAPAPGRYTLTVQGDESSRLSLELKPHAVAAIEWLESWEGSQAPLPLAEIRTVEVVWQAGLEDSPTPWPATDSGLCFVAETPWPGARYRWSASGGRLVEAGAGVIWEPPAGPGRYLLQVVADWGRAGLAVDALVLAVQEDGSIILGV